MGSEMCIRDRLYFVPPGLDLLIRLGLVVLKPLLSILVWLLVASTIVSMGQRMTLAKQLPSRPPEK